MDAVPPPPEHEGTPLSQQRWQPPRSSSKHYRRYQDDPHCFSHNNSKTLLIVLATIILCALPLLIYAWMSHTQTPTRSLWNCKHKFTFEAGMNESTIDFDFDVDELFTNQTRQTYTLSTSNAPLAIVQVELPRSGGPGVVLYHKIVDSAGNCASDVCNNASLQESVIDMLLTHLEARGRLPIASGVRKRTRDGRMYNVVVNGTCLRAQTIDDEGPEQTLDDCVHMGPRHYTRRTSMHTIVKPMTVDDESQEYETIDDFEEPGESEDILDGHVQSVCNRVSPGQTLDKHIKHLQDQGYRISNEERVTDVDEAFFEMAAHVIWESDPAAPLQTTNGRRLQNNAWDTAPNVNYAPDGTIQFVVSLDKSVKLFGRKFVLLAGLTIVPAKPDNSPPEPRSKFRLQLLGVEATKSNPSRIALVTYEGNLGAEDSGLARAFEKPLINPKFTLFSFGPLRLIFEVELLAVAGLGLEINPYRAFVYLQAGLQVSAAVKIRSPCFFVFRIELGIKIVGNLMKTQLQFGVWSSDPTQSLWTRDGQNCGQIVQKMQPFELIIRPTCEVRTGWRCKGRRRKCLRGLISRLTLVIPFGNAENYNVIASTCPSPPPPPPLPLAPPPRPLEHWGDGDGGRGGPGGGRDDEGLGVQIN